MNDYWHNQLLRQVIWIQEDADRLLPDQWLWTAWDMLWLSHRLQSYEKEIARTLDNFVSWICYD